MPVKLNSSGGGSVTLDVPSTAGTFTATIPANTGTVVTTGSTAAVTPAMLTQPLTLATAQNSTSGTSIDFTGIPSWAKRITVMFRGVSTNGSSSLLVQLGTSSGVVSSGYVSTSNILFNSATANGTNSTAGFVLFFNASGDIASGAMTITNISGNSWVSVATAKNFTNSIVSAAGDVALSGALDRIRITTVNGTDTFDAGFVNVMWEG